MGEVFLLLDSNVETPYKVEKVDSELFKLYRGRRRSWMYVAMMRRIFGNAKPIDRNTTPNQAREILRGLDG